MLSINLLHCFAIVAVILKYTCCTMQCYCGTTNERITIPYTVCTIRYFWNLNWFLLCTWTMAASYCYCYSNRLLSRFSISRTFVMANFIRLNNRVYAFDQCTIYHLCANLRIYSGLILHADILAGDHSISLRSSLLVFILSKILVCICSKTHERHQKRIFYKSFSIFKVQNELLFSFLVP